MLTATGNTTAAPTGKRADNDGDERASAGLARGRKRGSLSRLSPAPNPTAGRLQKTIDDIVRFTMALPEVEESTSWGKPALKRRGKLLFLLRDPETLSLVCGFEDRAAWLAAHPEMFAINDHYLNYPAVMVRLAHVDRKVLRAAVTAAWERAGVRPRKTPVAKKASTTRTRRP